MMSAVTRALAPIVSFRSSNCTNPSTLPSMARSSLPVISPFTCRLAPRRAVPVVDGYVLSKGAIVFASPENEDVDGVTATAGLGCCGTGGLAGASGFLSPHIDPPWAQICKFFTIDADRGYQSMLPRKPLQIQNGTGVSGR